MVNMEFKRITNTPRQMGGVPCLRGLRIPVATVVALVAQGQAAEDILALYPDLEADDVRESLLFWPCWRRRPLEECSARQWREQSPAPGTVGKLQRHGACDVPTPRESSVRIAPTAAALSPRFRTLPGPSHLLALPNMATCGYTSL
jgi:uncharacterized protein (DUF433 family)